MRGYVEFKCSGGFVERFLNLCNVNRLKLWDVKKRNGVLYATTDIKSYKEMHKCARKSGSVVRIVHKKGLPFLFANHRNRVGLLIGLAVFIIMLMVLTSFIWLVEIEGNESVEDAVLLE
ncbi:MAG: sporulation protein YqfD [Clostridiales bacterium]|nr:sporulation protein YqfD [Clostridiales bacterium]